MRRRSEGKRLELVRPESSEPTKVLGLSRMGPHLTRDRGAADPARGVPGGGLRARLRASRLISPGANVVQGQQVSGSTREKMGEIGCSWRPSRPPRVACLPFVQATVTLSVNALPSTYEL
jgi:hypothetical protein